MTGFYRKFVKDYAKIASAFIKALRKNEKINTYDPNYILPFESLKDIVTNARNLSIGAVLSQEAHAIAYASRTLNN